MESVSQSKTSVFAVRLEIDASPMTSARLAMPHSTVADVRARLIQRTLWDAHFSVHQVGLDFSFLLIQ